MKNIFISATLLLTCFLLGACGRSSSSSQAAEADTGTGKHAATAQASASASSSVTEEAPASAEITAATDPLEDNDILLFSIDDIDPDGEWGYTVHTSAQNRSDKNLTLSMGNVSVNGVMADPGWTDTVNAGMQTKSDIVWPSGSLSEKGIDDVTIIEFELIAFNEDDESEGYLIDKVHTIYPKGEHSAETAHYTKADGDEVLFDDGDCSMIITGKNPDGEWGYTLTACLINKKDSPLMFAAGEAAVNDTMCDPCWAESVAAGKIARCQIIWPREELEDAGIDKVTQIQLPVSVYDDETYEEVRAEQTFAIKN